MNWQSIVLTSIASGVVSGVVAVVVVLLKQFYDQRIEEQKAKYGCASWVHQRQVEALTKLFVELHRMKDLLQGATRGFKSQDEMSQEGYFEKWQLKAAETWSEYIEHKLLLNKAIVTSIEELFDKFNEAGIAIRLAPIYSEGEMRKEAIAAQIKAKEIAHKLIPPLLDAIESEARIVVHDECRS